MNTASTGTVPKEAAVMILSHSGLFSVVNIARPTGSVTSSLLLTMITGHRKAFQLPRKVKIARADTAGMTRGRAILA